MVKGEGVRSYRSVDDSPGRPEYSYPPVGQFRDFVPPKDAANQIPDLGGSGALRMIYFDTQLAAPLIDRVAATEHGRRTLPSSLLVRTNGVLGAHNAVVILTGLVASTLQSGPATDVCTGASISDLPMDLHPSQVLSVRGRVTTGRDVMPTSFLLTTEIESIRVLVDRSHGLHLNQAYLTEREIWVLGTVNSVSRRTMRAVAALVDAGSDVASE
jgi:hypothetical protein